nr:MAG TPA: hypothetical protein [Bacteriophage sp.]
MVLVIRSTPTRHCILHHRYYQSYTIEIVLVILMLIMIFIR